jgi:hypothetical protein
LLIDLGFLIAAARVVSPLMWLTAGIQEITTRLDDELIHYLIFRFFTCILKQKILSRSINYGTLIAAESREGRKIIVLFTSLQNAPF